VARRARRRKIILDVGGGTGEWSRPYRLDGRYDVRIIDPKFFPYWTARRYLERRGNDRVHGVFLTPPCTEFAVSGSRWWKSKSESLLNNAIATVYEFLELKDAVKPEWWALENPVGRLGTVVPELGWPKYKFQPWMYGDNEIKYTCIWGEHERPPIQIRKRPNNVVARVHREPPSAQRATIRSIIPSGFAQAFYETNP
jgi:hypothetical protein